MRNLAWHFCGHTLRFPLLERVRVMCLQQQWTEANEVPDEYEDESEIECQYAFILKDDIGDVCRICGVIKRGIETIIEYNFSKSELDGSEAVVDDGNNKDASILLNEGGALKNIGKIAGKPKNGDISVG